MKIKIVLTWQEFTEFTNTLQDMFTNPDTFKHLNYLDFYNIGTLLKRLVNKKQLSFFMTQPKKIKISIDINEHQSLFMLYSLNLDYANVSDYTKVIYNNIFLQLDKQILHLQKIVEITTQKTWHDN
jgi:hypothetical protein